MDFFKEKGSSFLKKLLFICIIIGLLSNIYYIRSIYPGAQLTNEDVLIEQGCVEAKSIRQTLKVFHDDRVVEAFSVCFSGELEENCYYKITLVQDEIGQEFCAYSKDIDISGWCKLPFNIDQEASITELIIDTTCANEECKLLFAQDNNGIGTCYLDDKEIEEILVLRIDIHMLNSEWGWEESLLLLAIFCMLVISLIINNIKGECKDGCYWIFLLMLGVNFLIPNLVCPDILRVPQIAENSLNFYYLTDRYGPFESITKTDAGYLPLLQRIVSIFWIHIMKQGTNSLFFMQITAIIFGAITTSIIVFPCFSKLGGLKRRIILAMCISILFANSSVSTFFNYIYLGYFLIMIVWLCNEYEISRVTFFFLACLCGLVCMSKGLFVVFCPISIVSYWIGHKVLSKRKKFFLVCLAVGSTFQLLCALYSGGVAKWTNIDKLMQIIETKMNILIAVVGAGSVILVFFLKKYCLSVVNRRISKINCVEKSFIIMAFVGSGSLAYIASKGLELANVMNWGTAWWIPCNIALLVGLSSCVVQYKSCFFRVVLNLVCAIFLGLLFWFSTSNKNHVNYNCVSWKIYSEYFDYAIVPVFKYTERFGTSTNGHILFYSGNMPVDNYEYGAPYIIEEYKCTEIANNTYKLPALEKEDEVRAVYVNYPNDVGNVITNIILYDNEGKIIETSPQITPLSSKTIGYIFSPAIKDANAFSIQTAEYEKMHIEENVYISVK